MVSVAGVRFKQNGKVYYFDPAGFELKKGDKVIVETSRGLELGDIVNEPMDLGEAEVSKTLKPIIRMAEEKDIKQAEKNKEKEKQAYDICIEKIEKHGLDMKLVEVEYTFDGSKIIFYFTSDGRVDFRELVKDLAGIFRTRIELRQIGVRDETRAMGGVGVCGREYCCHSFQSEFAPVSIRMAKDQGLSLNPEKIYGACGRLMCCIRYEEEAYKELNKGLPRAGDTTVTEDGHSGTVSAVNILRQKVKVVVDLGNDEREVREYDAGELEFTKKKKNVKDARRRPVKAKGENSDIITADMTEDGYGSEDTKQDVRPIPGEEDGGTVPEAAKEAGAAGHAARGSEPGAKGRTAGGAGIQKNGKGENSRSSKNNAGSRKNYNNSRQRQQRSTKTSAGSEKNPDSSAQAGGAEGSAEGTDQGNQNPKRNNYRKNNNRKR